MKIFQCDSCGQPLFFENTKCEKCSSSLGYIWRVNMLSALVEKGDAWEAIANPEAEYLYCPNHDHGACNWLVPASAANPYCRCCELNRTIPNLEIPKNLYAWRKLESAKHRLVYSLLRLGLPVAAKKDGDKDSKGILFDFLADIDGEEPVLTGHANGVITVNVAEADSVHREAARRKMGEPYRTLIGHFRHEIGHYYWDVLVRDDESILDEFRALFGDETQNYSDALERHYADGAPDNWRDNFVSSYASSHPWEDWAETWAHYLHLVDTLETAYSFGMSLDANLKPPAELKMQATFDPYNQPDLEPILKATLPITFAVNSLNRGMGQPDLYPFVLPDPVLKKMRFVHQLIQPE
ncbi:MAG: putative zinc-binding peptidase [Verrucomicrobiota bacterium]